MPESPEVSYQAEYIVTYFGGKLLKDVNILRGRYVTHGPPENFSDFVAALPLKLENVEKKGKVIFLTFSNNWFIISKLGLTGHWYKPGDEPKWVKTEPNVQFNFTNNTSLIYTDNLSYGTITITNNIETVNKEITKLAPDITDIRLPVLLKRIAEKPKWGAKLMEDILMDQGALFSGVGNYMTAEILYEAKIAPKRRVDSLTADNWDDILVSARKIIKRMSGVIGDSEKYTTATRIYQKKMDPYGNPVITHTSKTGRTIYWVPDIQL